MSYSVSLWFDEDAEARVRNVWQRLEGVGVGTFAGSPVRPHVTLAHSLDMDLGPFITNLSEQLESHPSFELTFPGLGLFVDSGVLYLSTIMTGALWALHREVAELTLEHGTRSSPYYLPDRWTPHCTLALTLTPKTMLDAVRFCQSVPFPLAARATRVGIIENPSEVEILALPLVKPE